MNEAWLAGLRHLLGWIAAACCLGAAGILVDGLAAGAMNPQDVPVVPGETVSLTGPAPSGTDTPADVVVTTNVPGVSLAITGQFRGFWLGNRMWRGELWIDPQAPAGPATVTLYEGESPPQRVQVRVYGNQAARNAASPSLTRRLTGRSPFALAAALVLPAFLAAGGGYLSSRRLETGWLAQGFAVITSVAETSEGPRVSCDLATGHGLVDGEPVTIRNRSGRVAATGTVRRHTSTSVDFLVAGAFDAHPGCPVRIETAGTPNASRREQGSSPV